ncbi:hypothetical protein IVB12_08500 [Bradyrhizobium sp. 179]|uniref:hypothetical protein n=1 Tax=Bradyrhizobium sp. 179 TaxID=2782648 RepID=UPI001FF736AA|nr:hypothetical protein [Bradyrhizobium sp. 179]MCK1542008.1 hypothetical protein [Bradyrhizobium sp. 179]
MNALIGFLTLGSLIGIAVGLVMCVFQQQRSRGKQIAFYGVVAFAFVLSFALFQGPKDSAQATTGQPTQATAAASPPTYSDVLGKLKIDSVTWEKEGFGTIMKASFVIRNYSTVDVKDVVVTCRHSGNSGTYIDSNTRTIFEVVPHNSYQAVIDLNMGFIHSAVVRSACAVQGYSRT